MGFPPINHCLVCENIRAEQRGLVSVLGFYGVAPDVELLVRDFGSPLGLSFLLLGAVGGQGNFKVSLRLSDESGNTVMATPELDIQVADPSKHANFGMQIAAFKLPSPGKYNLELIVDGQSHYRTSFRAKQGGPGDFA